MNAYKFPFISKPVKGIWYYEIQVGPIVIMWQHDMSHKPIGKRGPRVGRLYIWWDKMWFFEVAYPVRTLCRRF